MLEDGCVAVYVSAALELSVLLVDESEVPDLVRVIEVNTFIPHSVRSRYLQT